MARQEKFDEKEIQKQFLHGSEIRIWGQMDSVSLLIKMVGAHQGTIF